VISFFRGYRIIIEVVVRENKSDPVFNYEIVAFAGVERLLLSGQIMQQCKPDPRDSPKPDPRDSPSVSQASSGMTEHEIWILETRPLWVGDPYGYGV
jgi:hypothetical protein